MTLHLSDARLQIQQIEGKGRGLVATHIIPAQTLIEVSPVLIFSPQEYQEHGRHTILDSYTFTWPTRDGTMALALGLGAV